MLKFEDGPVSFGALLGLLSLAGLVALSADQVPDAPQISSFGPAGLTGQGTLGATITLLDSAGNPPLIGGTPVRTVVAADGTYGPVTSATPQPLGNASITARDASGLTSPATTLAYDGVPTSDTTPPAMPLATSSMNATTGVITTSGTAEPGSTVRVTFPDGSTATATASATTGAFTIISPAGQPSGNVVTTARDASGRTSSADTDAITENVRPAIPTINASITDQSNTVSGTGEVGAVVTVRNASNAVVGSATVCTDGRWSFVAATAVPDDAVLTATQRDAAGNVSDTAMQTRLYRSARRGPWPNGLQAAKPFTRCAMLPPIPNCCWRGCGGQGRGRCHAWPNDWGVFAKPHPKRPFCRPIFSARPCLALCAARYHVARFSVWIYEPAPLSRRPAPR